jgi:hypothetical protein
MNNICSAQIHWFEAVVGGEEDTVDYKRRLDLQAKDPITTTPLIPFIKAKIAECEATSGGHEAFKAKLATVMDPQIIHEVYKML